MISIASTKDGIVTIRPNQAQEYYWILNPRPTLARIESVSVIFGSDGLIFRCLTQPDGRIVYVDESEIYESDQKALVAHMDRVEKAVLELKETLPG